MRQPEYLYSAEVIGEPAAAAFLQSLLRFDLSVLAALKSRSSGMAATSAMSCWLPGGDEGAACATCRCEHQGVLSSDIQVHSITGADQQVGQLQKAAPACKLFTACDIMASFICALKSDMLYAHLLKRLVVGFRLFSGLCCCREGGK